MDSTRLLHVTGLAFLIVLFLGPGFGVQYLMWLLPYPGVFPPARADADPARADLRFPVRRLHELVARLAVAVGEREHEPGVGRRARTRRLGRDRLGRGANARALYARAA